MKCTRLHRVLPVILVTSVDGLSISLLLLLLLLLLTLVGGENKGEAIPFGDKRWRLGVVEEEEEEEEEKEKEEEGGARDGSC